MIHTEKAVRTLQAVAMTVGLALFLWSTGLPTLFQFAEAASISNASDTLTNSNPSTVSNHTIAFTLPNGLQAGGTITLDFTNFGTLPSTGFDFNDMDLYASGTERTLGSSASGPTWGVATTSTSIIFTSGTDTVGSSTEVVIEIGSNATAGATGDTQITNPASTNSYPIDITAAGQDTGQVRVAIVDEVTVTASVDTSLTFTVAGVGNATSVNATSTTGTTTATTIPFGTLTVGDVHTLAHDLTVGTNAQNGYSVTVSLSGPLQSTLGGVIDSFIDGADTAIPTSWTSPSATLSDVKTYGHWGITSEDATTSRSNEFGSNQWAGIATSSPTVIMGHTGPADELTQGIGVTRIGYQTEISALQEAGDDYSTTLRYIVTPTF